MANSLRVSLLARRDPLTREGSYLGTGTILRPWTDTSHFMTSLGIILNPDPVREI